MRHLIASVRSAACAPVGPILKLLLIVVVLACGAAAIYWKASHPPAPHVAQRPNVLLISIDTVRADHLGCFGYPKPTTPNLDRFARENVLFKNCRSQAPW